VWSGGHFRRFRGSNCLHHKGLMMQAVTASETPVCLYRKTRRNIPEDSHLHLLDVSSSATRDKLCGKCSSYAPPSLFQLCSPCRLVCTAQVFLIQIAADLSG
jgi:hypothetical protein